MAGLKETPRQKMIGMMYLVLTALLALNVQREILDSFVTLNNGIEQTNTDNNIRTDILYGDFKFAYNLDPEKTENYWESANEIKTFSSELNEWVDSLKVEIISKSENIPIIEADSITLKEVENLESYDAATLILIGTKEDASEGKANELHEKIIKYQEKLNSILTSFKLSQISSGINFEDQTKEDELQNWELTTFYDTPLAAVVAILNKIQGNISTMEYTAVNELFSELDGEDIPIDTIVARIIPSKRYVMLGDDYHSEIFLGAYSTTVSPKMEITGSSNKEIEVIDGVGKYSFHPTRPGVYEYQGQITVTDKKGREKQYPFKSEFIAVPPTAVVSPTAMNVLYKGLKNPISISVPGIEDENVVATISGAGNKLTKIGPGRYEVKLANNSSNAVSIKVSAKLGEGNTQSMGSMDFRAKNLPKPYAKLGTITSNARLTKNELINMRGLIAKYSEDFIFNLPIRVNSFKVEVWRNGTPSTKISRDNKYTSDIKTLFGSLRAGNQVIFSDIEVIGADKKRYILNPIIITIKS